MVIRTVIQKCMMTQGVIGEILSRDWLARYLLEHSGMSLTQVDTLLISREYRYRGDSLQEMTLARDGGRVSKGSFDRTLRQGKNNIRKSVNTIVFAYFLGLFDKELLLSLVRICDLLIDLRGMEVSESRLKDVASVIEQASDRFVG